MAETLILDPSAVATNRTQFDITSWISGDGIDWGDAQIEAYLAEASVGQVPVDYRIPNRTIVVPLRIKTVGATSFDTFRQSIQAKVALLQREGGWLSRQTSVGTVYADVVNATLRLGGSWAQAYRSADPDASLTLECSPDFYGAEITLDSAASSTAELSGPLKLSASNAAIKGDYPARVRVTVTDTATQSRLGLLWGFRAKNYSSAATAALTYEAEALTVLDTAAIATVTGASGGGSNNAVSHTNLGSNWTPMLSTQIAASGHMTHKGTYRVWARCRTTSTTQVRLRFLWDVGDLIFPEENNATTLPGASNFYVRDFGTIRLDAVPTGTHRWLGVFQAQGAVGGENVSIDKIWFQPADESSGALSAPLAMDPGLVSYAARDEFNQSAGNLTAKTLPVGGAWANAGAEVTDFTVNSTLHCAQHTQVSGNLRLALAGTTTWTNVVVRADVTTTANPNFAIPGVFARYVDTSNWLELWHNDGNVVLRKWIAGTPTELLRVTPGYDVAATVTLALMVLASGSWTVMANDTLMGTGSDTALATGGTLATGKAGLSDNSAGGPFPTNTWDNFAVWVPSTDAVLYSGQTAELRYDGMFRKDSTGTAFGPISQATGDLARIPPSGLEARPVELFIKPSRGDFDDLPDAGATDAFSAQAFYRPSWLTVPGT